MVSQPALQGSRRAVHSLWWGFLKPPAPLWRLFLLWTLLWGLLSPFLGTRGRGCPRPSRKHLLWCPVSPVPDWGWKEVSTCPASPVLHWVPHPQRLPRPPPPAPAQHLHPGQSTIQGLSDLGGRSSVLQTHVSYWPPHVTGAGLGRAPWAFQGRSLPLPGKTVLAWVGAAVVGPEPADHATGSCAAAPFFPGVDQLQLQ